MRIPFIGDKSALVSAFRSKRLHSMNSFIGPFYREMERSGFWIPEPNEYVIFNLSYFSNDENWSDTGRGTSARFVLDSSLFPSIVALLS